MPKKYNVQQPSQQIPCLFCNKLFTAYASLVRRGGGKFCSRKCSGDFHTTPVEQRFWEKVDKSESCWIWKGTTYSNGYGRICVNGKHVLAHRLSWTLTHSDIPDGFHVCHGCDTPLCVNPEHLFLGTQKDNMQDMISKGRRVNPVMPRGEYAYAAKLTREQVDYIRSSSLSVSSLARELGVTIRTVSLIRRRITWKDE